jgi:hypothetical protein
MSEFNLARIPVDSSDLSPEGVLVMLAEELGYAVEYGFTSGQFLFRKRAEGYLNIKTLYCSARIRDNKVTIVGSLRKNRSVSLFDPDCFDKLQKVLEDDLFWVTTSKDMDTPIFGSS